MRLVEDTRRMIVPGSVWAVRARARRRDPVAEVFLDHRTLHRKHSALWTEQPDVPTENQIPIPNMR